MDKMPIDPSLKRNKLNSGLLDEAAYDTKTETMYIRFKVNGSIYKYNPVPEKKFDAMVSSPSSGAYFHKHFKNKKGINAEKL